MPYDIAGVEMTHDGELCSLDAFIKNVGADRKLTYSDSADPNLTRVFNLPCLLLEQGRRSDHPGHDWRVKPIFFREKKSAREIVRLTSLSRNTVRKWLKATVVVEPKYRRGEAPGKLTPFHDATKQALKVAAHRPRHERRTARAPHG